MSDSEPSTEVLIAEVKRLRRALRKIASCPNPDSVENCHDQMWVIANGSAATRRNTRLAGHTLEGEGRARLKAGCCGTEGSDGMPNNYDRMGHGRCSCGEFGPCEATDRARQMWHHDHKNQVRTDAYFAEHTDA